LKKNQLILGVVVLAALVALVVWGSNRIHFDFGVFRAQLAMASWAKIGIAVGFIYIGYLFRSVRWAFLLRHEKKVPPFSLLSTQVIGFAAVALIGRVADPVRPYLVATSGFFAHLLAPLLHRFPVLSEILTRFGALLLTLVGVLVLVAVRLSGGVVARLAEKSFGLVSKNLGRAIGHKIRTFHAGLYAVRNFSDFAIVTALSLSMWCLITLAYLETVQAFTASPELAGMNLAKCILLMAISGGASALQLPVLGWFSQIAFVAAALSSFFGARPEAATACAATLLFVTFLSIIPVGVIWARFEHVNLRKVTVESEHAGADLDENGIATEA
jgi:hypothetical protein